MKHHILFSLVIVTLAIFAVSQLYVNAQMVPSDVLQQGE